MSDLSAIPVRITVLDDGMLVEVNPGHLRGSLSFVPLTPQEIEVLKDACPDECDGEPWRGT
jgi:hypothetical protein